MLAIGRTTAGFALAEADGDGAGAGVDGVEVGDGAAAGAAEDLIVCPLFQTRRDPFLMQVNFLPALIDVAFSFEHLSPAFTAAKELSGEIKAKTRMRASVLRIGTG